MYISVCGSVYIIFTIQVYCIDDALYACPVFMFNPVYFKVYCIDDGSYFSHIIYLLQMYIAYIFIHCLALFIVYLPVSYISSSFIIHVCIYMYIFTYFSPHSIYNQFVMSYSSLCMYVYFYISPHIDGAIFIIRLLLIYQECASHYIKFHCLPIYSTQAGPDRVGSGRVESGRVGSGRVG